MLSTASSASPVLLTLALIMCAGHCNAGFGAPEGQLSSITDFKEDAVKAKCEMDYWNSISKREEGGMANSWYESFYTTYFGIDKSWYTGKKHLDIGCGPRGSLEWNVNAQARVCADPLAVKYGEIGSNKHAMVYINAGAEHIPVPSNSFDVVTSMNNLDHVTNLAAAVYEIVRVLRLGGTFLLIVESHAKPTQCEPLTFGWDEMREVFEEAGMDSLFEKHFETETSHCKTAKSHLSNSHGTSAIVQCPEFDHSDPTPRAGFLQLRMIKRRRAKKVIRKRATCDQLHPFPYTMNGVVGSGCCMSEVKLSDTSCPGHHFRTCHIAPCARHTGSG